MVLNIHQKISLFFALLILIFSMYDVLFHSLLWILHILFEVAEYVLDHFIDHLFGIGDRKTEVVVFYLLISLIGYGFYQLYRLLPRWKEKCKQKLIQQVSEAFTQWQDLSVLSKMAWWVFFLSAFNCWLFLT